MKAARIVGLVAAVVLVGGCSITRRHRSISNMKIRDASRGRTSVSLFVLSGSETIQSKSIFDLEGDGQRALIDRVDEIAEIRGDLTPERRPTSTTDLATITRRLVVNLVHRPIATGKWHPADRVVWSDMNIEVAGGFEFRSYDRLDTGYEDIDLGELSRSFSWDVNATGSGGVSLGQNNWGTDETTGRYTTSGVGLGANGWLSGSVEGSLGEQLWLQRRIVTAAVALEDSGQRMRIIREGATGIDLTGAVVIDATIVATDNRAYGVFVVAPAAEEPQHTQAVEPASAESEAPPLVANPPICQPTLDVKRRGLIVSNNQFVELNVSGESLIRSVVSGAYTIRESDDRVNFERSMAAKVSYSIELASVVVYQLRTKTNVTSFVNINENDTNEPLLFTTRDHAQFVQSWLTTNSVKAFEQASCGRTLVDEVGRPLKNEVEVEVVPLVVGYGG